MPVTEEELRGARDDFESALGHAEDADLVDAAEPVLGGAQDSMIERALALEVQHRVHDMLERLRAGDAAALRDVTDDEDGGAAVFGEPHQAGRTLADLPDVAGRAL